MNLKKILYLPLYGFIFMFSLDAMHQRKITNTITKKTKELADLNKKTDSECLQFLGQLNCLNCCCNGTFYGIISLLKIPSQLQ